VVRAFRNGQSLRVIAKRFGVSVSFVYRCVVRAGDQRLDRVDWNDHCTTRDHTHNRTPAKVECCILQIRKNLKAKSALGEYGAVAIQREMKLRNCPVVPSISTINLILKRHGCFDSRHRIRCQSPPRGWYLPDVVTVTGGAELDSFDYVEGLRLTGKHGFVQIFNGISLHGHLVCSFPFQRMTAENTVSALLKHWQEFGIPSYAQFDNATVFTGFPGVDSVGQVIRFCLLLGVTPVFAPPRETGFQASVERYNGQWQKSVWERFHFKNYRELLEQSDLYVNAHRDKHWATIEETNNRYDISDQMKQKIDKPLKGTIIFIRRTDNNGNVNILGHQWLVDSLWTNRLIRAEVIIDKNIIKFYRLRRREPDKQPLLNTAKYHLNKNLVIKKHHKK
jgi:hypothetical protein